jgi:hypothetical protein
MVFVEQIIIFKQGITVLVFQLENYNVLTRFVLRETCKYNIY